MLMSWPKNYNKELIELLRKVKPANQDIKINNNLTIEELSEILTWNEFEKLTALIMEKKGFEVDLNYRINRKEIDVLAHNSRYLIGIDCKHWKIMGRSSLGRAVQMQKARIKLVMRYFKGLLGIPVIVTLYEGFDKQLYNTPIVPINKLISFVNELDGYVNQFDTVGP